MKRIYYIASLMLTFTLSACGDDITEIQRPEGWGVDVGDEENVYGDIVIKDESEPMVHPGCLHSADDLKRAKEKVAAGEAPWIDGWNALIESDNFKQSAGNGLPATALAPNATAKIVRGGNTVWESDPDNYNNAAQQAHAAYYYAVAWKMTDDVKYAQAAVNILNAWAETCKSINGDSNMSLAAGLYGYQFANAGELLRDYEGWTAEDFKAYQQWMIDVFYKANNDFLVRHHDAADGPLVYWANWDLCNLASMLSIGILADRRDIYNEAIKYLFEGDGNGNLTRTIVHVFDGENEGLAQVQESGRDQGHATLVVALLGVIAQTTWNQGDDFFGWNDNVILKASEYMAKYNVARLDVPFEPYSFTTDGGGTFDVISAEGRGTARDMWEVLYNHYAKVKNVEPKWTTYTLMGVNAQRPEKPTSVTATGGALDQLGIGTLMYAR